MGGDGHGYFAMGKTIFHPHPHHGLQFGGYGKQHFCYYCDVNSKTLDVVNPSGVIGGINPKRTTSNSSRAYDRLYYVHAYHHGSLEGMAVKWLHGENRFTDEFISDRWFFASGACTHLKIDKPLERVLKITQPLMREFWTPSMLEASRSLLALSITSGALHHEAAKKSPNLARMIELLKSDQIWDESAYRADLIRDRVEMVTPNGLSHWIRGNFTRKAHWKPLYPGDRVSCLPQRMTEGNAVISHCQEEPLLLYKQRKSSKAS